MKGVIHLLRKCLGIGSLISIHTPAKGVTETNDLIEIAFLFQSTLPRRE
jgi:hypothetical protein